jgi:hypothetical protein
VTRIHAALQRLLIYSGKPNLAVNRRQQGSGRELALKNACLPYFVTAMLILHARKIK